MYWVGLTCKSPLPPLLGVNLQHCLKPFVGFGEVGDGVDLHSHTRGNVARKHAQTKTSAHTSISPSAHLSRHPMVSQSFCSWQMFTLHLKLNISFFAFISSIAEGEKTMSPFCFHEFVCSHTTCLLFFVCQVDIREEFFNLFQGWWCEVDHWYVKRLQGATCEDKQNSVRLVMVSIVSNQGCF